MTKLSDTQRIILSQASQRDDRLAIPPERLPAAARQTVAKSLLKHGLVSDEPASAFSARDAWQIDGRSRLLRITDEGLRAISIEPEPANAVDRAELGGLTLVEYEEEQALARAAIDAGMELCADTTNGLVPKMAAERRQQPEDAMLPAAPQGESLTAVAFAPPSASGEAPQVPQRPSVSQRGGSGRAAALRMAAAAVTAAWAAPDRDGLEDAVTALRRALDTQPGRESRDPSAPRQLRAGTKQEAVLALLRRDEGTTIARIIDATGWQPHTVRGFLAGLKRKGITVEVLERVRQVGPNKQGAKGSFSVYRITADAPAAAEAG